MSVYLDRIGHLTADSREELHAFARLVGIPRRWFADRPRLWRYDLLSLQLQGRALKAGAIWLKDPRDSVRVLRRANGEPSGG
jgi:hypothetical protein